MSNCPCAAGSCRVSAEKLNAWPSAVSAMQRQWWPQVQQGGQAAKYTYIWSIYKAELALLQVRSHPDEESLLCCALSLWLLLF